MESGGIPSGDAPTIEEIERLVAEAVERVEQGRALRRKLEEAQKQLEAERRRLSECAAVLQKQESDVKRLEGLGLTALFYQVLGKRDELLPSSATTRRKPR